MQTSFTAPNTPGVSYEITFEAESCEDGSWFFGTVECPADYFGATPYAVFDQSTVIIEVIPEPDLTLKANGVAGTVQVDLGAQVVLTVEADNCSNNADQWRDTWSDTNGIGVPNPLQSEHDNSVCNRGPSRTFTAPTSPGTYSITFGAESCRDHGPPSTRCPSYQPFGQGTVTIEVVELPFVGTGIGLLGWYCNNSTPTQPAEACPSNPDLERIDPTVDFDWGNGSPDSAIDNNQFSARWSGEIQAQLTEDYILSTRSDDGIRVTLDGNVIIDNFTDHGSTRDDSAPISLQKGERYDITIEYYENGGGAVAELYWESASTPRAIVPETQLYPLIPPPTTGLEADYHMDEDAWDGTADEVADASGSGNDGTAQGDADTDAADPALAGSPGTCGYGVFDGNGDYVQVPDLSVLQGTATLAFWIRTTQAGDDTVWEAPGVTGIEQSGGADDIFWGWIDGSGEIRITAGNDADEDAAGDTTINDGAWHHVALTRDAVSGATQIYIDGELKAEADSAAGTIGNTFSSLGRIEDTAGTPEYFNGALDEVRVYGRVLTGLEVQALLGVARPCGGVDHFVIQHDGAGINCRPEPVIVTAVDALGDTVTDFDGSIQLSTDTGHGDWAIDTGSGPLSGGGGDDGAADYDFDPADAGTVTLLLTDSHQESVDIGVSDGAASDADGEGSLTFRPYGFELTPSPIPTQIAGRSFDLTLTAVGETPSDPGCDVIEGYAGAKNVKFWFDYENPGTGTVQVQVAGDPIAAGAGAAAAQAVMFSSGSATIAVAYADAGRIQFHARDDAGIGEPPAGTGTEIVAGGTGPFVVRPFGFMVDVPADTGATGPAGAAPFTAGVVFSATVMAKTWQSADDTDADGQPDTGADLADNATTPNFGQEATPETVDLTATVAAPTGGADGTLSNATFTGFNNGASTRADLQWNEVGYVTLAAALSDGDYLGTGMDVQGTAAMIGRFIPAYFTSDSATLTDRAALTGCTDDFSYIGERLDNDFTLSARNADGGITTNYEGTFAHLDTANELNLAATDAGTALPLTVETAAITWTAGVGAAATELHIDRSGRVGPYDPAKIGIDPTDDDGVALQTTGLDLDTNGDGTGDHAETGQTELRFGRLVIDNAGGAEIAPIELPVRAEYWTGDTWNINGLDNCTTFALATEIQLDNDATAVPVMGDQPIAIGAGQTRIDASDDPITLTNGEGNATFAAPGAGNTGWVDVTGLLGAGSPGYDFLRGDPEDDSSWTTDPQGRVTFGIYAGDERWIDIRRVPVN